MTDNPDSFTETTTTSWLSRIGESIKGILVGLALVAGSGAFLFWNEGRAVQTERSLTEGAGLVTSVAADRVDPASEGKLIHVSGDTKTTAALADADFGVTTQALRLVRTVEMYQWKEEERTETRKNVGGSEEKVTTYTYVRTWSDRRIDSSKFKRSGGHENPQMRYQERNVLASDATLGAFKLDGRVLQLLPAEEELRVEPALAETARRRVGGSAQVVDGRFYIGADPGSPRIGDLRIGYRYAKVGPASVIGRQTGSGFGDYQTQAGDRLLMARPGAATAAAMFKAAQDENRILTWVLRLVGVIVMFVGWALVLRPLVVVADVVPLFGNILQAGTALVAGLLTAILAPLVIAIAWLWYRPLVSVVVLGIGATIVIGLRMLAARRRPAAPAGA